MQYPEPGLDHAPNAAGHAGPVSAAAQALLLALRPRLRRPPVVLALAGQPGAALRELAATVQELLAAEERSTVILLQDDYLRLPWLANIERREEQPSWVGPGELRLDLLERHIQLLRQQRGPLEKPLNQPGLESIESEVIAAGDYDLILVAGAYAALLKHVDLRVHIESPALLTEPRIGGPQVRAAEERLAAQHAALAELRL